MAELVSSPVFFSRCIYVYNSYSYKIFLNNLKVFGVQFIFELVASDAVVQAKLHLEWHDDGYQGFFFLFL